MTMTPAPLFDDIADGPSGGVAHWITTADEVRIRIGHWRPKGGTQGTVLMFPGRTEYIEKYGLLARDLAARGYAMLAVDWRGQGLADRLLPEGRIGHVAQFIDYQKDIAAVMRAARELDLPRPFHLLAHSMGGAIGLRAVMEGLPVQTCAFSAPMWGIQLTPLMRPLALALAYGGTKLGFGETITPNSDLDNYVLTQLFEGNVLTSDRDMYKQMQDQLASHPELGLGGASLNWLRESLSETSHLVERSSPDIPCVTFLGSNEQIVDPQRIIDRMDVWPRGTLEIIEGGEHEVLMESPTTRASVLDRLETLLSNGKDAS
ncbi:MAG: lysophospholipase [Paracoccaceae bacterium]|jgi:lysophospholipase